MLYLQGRKHPGLQSICCFLPCGSLAVSAPHKQAVGAHPAPRAAFCCVCTHTSCVSLLQSSQPPTQCNRYFRGLLFTDEEMPASKVRQPDKKGAWDVAPAAAVQQGESLEPLCCLETGSWEQAIGAGECGGRGERGQRGPKSSPHLGTRWKLNSIGRQGRGCLWVRKPGFSTCTGSCECLGVTNTSFRRLLGTAVCSFQQTEHASGSHHAHIYASLSKRTPFLNNV